MRYESFIKRVREVTGLSSREEAERVTRATLETLGERISRTERARLAAQLPADLKGFVLARNQTDRFTLEEFYDRVGARAKLASPHAITLARSVMRVLGEAITPGEMEDIRAELTADYNELFGKEPQTPASPTSLTTRQERHLEKSGPSHGETPQ